MRSNVRFALLAPLIGAILAFAAPAAAQAAVEIEKFVGVNCAKVTKGAAKSSRRRNRRSEKTSSEAPRGNRGTHRRESEEQGYRQAAGRVPYGITDFMVTHTGEYNHGTAIPTGVVTHVRVDVAPGLATSPAAVPQCTQAEFGETEAIPGTGFYLAPKCKTGTGPHGTGPESTVIGEEKATVFVQPLAEKGHPPDVALKGVLYNLVQPEGRRRSTGQRSNSRTTHRGHNFEKRRVILPLATEQYYAHTIVEGNVEWGKEAKGTGAADYHDYFEVKVSPASSPDQVTAARLWHGRKRRLHHERDQMRTTPSTRPPTDVGRRPHRHRGRSEEHLEAANWKSREGVQNAARPQRLQPVPSNRQFDCSRKPSSRTSPTASRPNWRCPTIPPERSTRPS